jgi:hypothetical protein
MCDCCDRTTTREVMERRHGTIQDFERAVNKAADDLWVTTAEAEAAIERYREGLGEG